MPIADCGHTYEGPAGGTGPSGYAVNRATGKTLCYPCADELAVSDMATSHAFEAYLSSDGGRVTTWTGGGLMVVTRHTTSRGFHRSKVHHVRAESADGRKWHGSGSGPGMFILMRATKGSTV